MRTRILLGMASTALVVSATAMAATSDEARLQGYEAGWDAAQEFCTDLRPRTSDELTISLRSFKSLEMPTRDISEIFSKACKNGFDKHINNNWACQQRLEQESAYSKMWKARRSACE
ncbi:MAG TPA: hypothetical protein PKA58_17025 [Polyangium sp.]|jgi:hypothetical protein|nr:hypothetical protein [Polyangium sp.]